MNSGLARRALAHLDVWTWLVAEYRTWPIVIARSSAWQHRS